jgi:hypothetical protein
MSKRNKVLAVIWVAIVAMLIVLWCCGCATEALKREVWHIKRDTAIIASRDPSPEAQRAAKGAAAVQRWTGLPSSEPQIEDFEWDTRTLNAEAQARRGLFSGIAGLFSGLSGSTALESLLVALLGIGAIYAKRKISSMRADNEDMVNAIKKAPPEVKQAVAEAQARRMPLHKTVKRLTKS